MSTDSKMPIESIFSGWPEHGSGDLDSSQEAARTSKPSSAQPVPSCLKSQAYDTCFKDLVTELHPQGPLESLIVKDLARRAAAMERWAQAAEAVERQAAKLLPLVESLEVDADPVDAVLGRAMSTDIADRSERHALGHARAFYKALKQLRELQASRQSPNGCGENLPLPFPNEADCELFLADRFIRGDRPCANCRTTVGYYLPARRAWECAECGQQVGLRSGTVMARSPLTLVVWFEGIRWLLWNPTIGVPELQKKLNITRVGTVRKLAQKVRQAIASENSSELLAGLGNHWRSRPIKA